MLAVFYGHTDVVAAIIKRLKNDPSQLTNLEDMEINVCLSSACLEGNDEMVQLFIDELEADVCAHHHDIISSFY